MMPRDMWHRQEDDGNVNSAWLGKECLSYKYRGVEVCTVSRGAVSGALQARAAGVRRILQMHLDVTRDTAEFAEPLLS